MEVLERGGPGNLSAALVTPDLSDADAARCVGGVETVPGCWRLALARGASERIGAGVEHVTLSASAATRLGPGGYDLYLASSTDAAVRAPRAVWFRPDDPASIREVRFAVLSDLHVGRDVDEHDEHL